MIEELNSDPYKLDTIQNIWDRKKVIDCLIPIVNLDSKILDIGDRNLLTEQIEDKFEIDVDNTQGDLDEDFIILQDHYDIIIYSHVIEHQFNPLHTLLHISQVMDRNSKLFIFTPDRTKFLWVKTHYHEIDSYRMGLLCKRADLKIVDKIRYKAKRPFKSYLKGFRPILRLLFEYNAIYEIQKI